ncbi:unnamed protein product [Enterobius vermicularis]|uniref:Mic1 domain-containing protein n=1 Tax=Enterobius vermicularis TaxID=51028 RepID=A0A0N4UVS6_ENTVE|nr:unnamed protein product [Enterobius vermicularis]
MEVFPGTFHEFRNSLYLSSIESRFQICAISETGGKDVIVKGFKSEDDLTFCINDSGKVKVIKLSNDGRLISIQRETSQIEFICFSPTGDGTVTGTFSQSPKLRTARVVGLEWISNNQILFVTNQGLELYLINPTKKNAKLLKTCNISLYWTVYYAKSQLLIVSSGVSGSRFTPFLVQSNNIYRLEEFDVDFGCSNAKSILSKRDVSVASIYGVLYVMVFRYSMRDSSVLDVSMYKVAGDNGEKSSLAHTLSLGLTGPFAIHVVDNVIIVHHQVTVSSTSLLFDIRLQEGITSGVCSHKPFAAVSLSLTQSLKNGYASEIPLYSPCWVMFPQNIVIDTSAGLFASISLHPEESEIFIKDQVNFLCAARCNVFLESGTKYALVAELYEPLLVDQNDLVGVVFLPAVETSSSNKPFLMHCMLQYLQGLQENNIDVLPFFLNEVLVPTIVSSSEFNCLQQLLQYRVIPDAKQLAFFLLSHEAKHAPLIQLAVDMLARLGTAAEEIVEVLLSKGHVVEAIRYLEATSSIDRVSCLKLLECAWKGNRQVQYAVFTYFQKLVKLRNHNLLNIEQYDHYVRLFNNLFGKEEIEEAKHASQFAVLPRENKFQNKVL